MIEVETAFLYLGSRDYIHGTSILSGLVTALEHQEGGALTVKRLKFQRPAQSNGRLFLTTAPLDEAEAAAANCTVQATLGTTVWRGIFRDTGAPVRQRLAVGYPIDDVVAADFGGHCAIAPLDRDDLIRTLIEANKRFHELSLDVPAGAVRFGYLENWKVPPADTRFSGLLQAKNLIMRKTPDGYMTINRLTYTTDGPDASLTLCFNVIGTAGTP